MKKTCIVLLLVEGSLHFSEALILERMCFVKHVQDEPWKSEDNGD